MISTRNWAQLELGDLIETQKGFAFKSAWYCDTGHPIVKVSDFTQDSINTSSITKIPNEIAEKYLRYELLQGDVVMQTVGSWPSNPASVVGKCIRVPRLAHKALLNQNAVRLDPNGKILKRFLYYSLRSPKFTSYIVGTAQGAASQAAITLDAIRSYGMAVPPLTTQRKIIAILSAYDDLIEDNLRRIEILEEMTQSLYQEWFINFRFPGHENIKTVESPLGPIPEGWSAKKLGEIAQEIRRGVNPKNINPLTPYFGLEHLPRNSIALSEWGYAKNVHSTKLAFKKGEILFGKIRPYFHKVGVAPLDGICSSDTIVIVPRSQECYSAVLFCVSSKDFIDYATQTSQGTKMPRANWNVLVDYNIVLPSKNLLYASNKFGSDIVDQINNLLFRNANLRKTRDLLLPKLISGEIDVSDLNIEVPKDDTN